MNRLNFFPHLVIVLSLMLSTQTKVSAQYQPCATYDTTRTTEGMIKLMKTKPGIFSAYLKFIYYNICTEPKATATDRANVKAILDKARSTNDPEVLRPYLVNVSADHWSQAEYMNHTNYNGTIIEYDHEGKFTKDYTGFQYKGEYATFMKIFGKNSCGNPQKSKAPYVAPYVKPTEEEKKKEDKDTIPDKKKNGKKTSDESEETDSYYTKKDDKPCNDCVNPNLNRTLSSEEKMQQAAYDHEEKMLDKQLDVVKKQQKRSFIGAIIYAVVNSIHIGYSSGSYYQTGTYYQQPGGTYDVGYSGF